MVMGVVDAYDVNGVIAPMGFHVANGVPHAAMRIVGSYLLTSTRSHDLSEMEVWFTHANSSMLIMGGM